VQMGGRSGDIQNGQRAQRPGREGWGREDVCGGDPCHRAVESQKAPLWEGGPAQGGKGPLNIVEKGRKVAEGSGSWSKHGYFGNAGKNTRRVPGWEKDRGEAPTLGYSSGENKPNL